MQGKKAYNTLHLSLRLLNIRCFQNRAQSISINVMPKHFTICLTNI